VAGAPPLDALNVLFRQLERLSHRFGTSVGFMFKDSIFKLDSRKIADGGVKALPVINVLEMQGYLLPSQ